jgi:hypothetical protein
MCKFSSRMYGYSCVVPKDEESALLLCCRHYACGNFGGAEWPARYNLDFGPTGVFPLSGFRTFGDSAGPGWRGGSELLLIKHLGAEAGFTEGWPVGTDTCDRFGCTYSRHSLKLLDYGIRGVAPVAGGRLELSVGLGGGSIWHSSIDFPDRPNQALFQYSGKIAFAPVWDAPASLWRSAHGATSAVKQSSGFRQLRVSAKASAKCSGRAKNFPRGRRTMRRCGGSRVTNRRS